MLELKLERPPETLLEGFTITPCRLRDLSLDQIRRLPVCLGNRRRELGQWFSVSGDPGDLHHVWHGNLNRVNGIGHRMSEGLIQVEGDVGNHLGSHMTGGKIIVHGSAGNYTGAEMVGGLIRVMKHAGSSVGAAYDGGQNGQNGGVILIDGSAGNLVGKSMRRGVIAVGGDVKNCCGFGMKAGTIVVMGRARKNVGLEMTRGTIILVQTPEQPSTGFVDGGTHPMPVARMINRYLSEMGFPHSCLTESWRLLHGDPLRGGRGEILIAN